MTSASWLSVQPCFSTVWIVAVAGTLKQVPMAMSSAAWLFRTRNRTTARNTPMATRAMTAPIGRRRPEPVAATGLMLSVIRASVVDESRRWQHGDGAGGPRHRSDDRSRMGEHDKEV